MHSQYRTIVFFFLRRRREPIEVELSISIRIQKRVNYTRPRRSVLAPADRWNPVAGRQGRPLRRSAAVRGRGAGRWRRWGTRGRHERSKCWPAGAARLGLAPPAPAVRRSSRGGRVGAHLTRCCAEAIQCAGLWSEEREREEIIGAAPAQAAPSYAATVPFHSNSY
jgi:hypothetical protein